MIFNGFFKYIYYNLFLKPNPTKWTILTFKKMTIIPYGSTCGIDYIVFLLEIDHIPILLVGKYDCFKE